MRSGSAQERIVQEKGNVADALAGARHVVSQIGRGPYQMHAAFGPNCAVADVSGDSAIVMSPTQDAYGTRATLARVLGLPADKIPPHGYASGRTRVHCLIRL